MKNLLLALLPLALLGSQPTCADDLREIVFDAIERQIIAEYYRQHGDQDEAGKPGRKKKSSLPPGIARNLERGKPLPPGIAKRALPAELEARLPRAPEGHERVIVDGRVLLIDITTGVIRDKLEDVLLKD